MPPADDDPPDGTWLSDEQMSAWLPFVRLLSTLPNALDRQLRDEAGITHVYYQVLAMLSEAEGSQRRMSDLARLAGTSLSRLSHAVATLETKGWVVREPSTDDRRGQVARLTDAGRALLAETAPGHAREVRHRVFDRLTAQETRTLGALSQRLLEGL